MRRYIILIATVFALLPLRAVTASSESPTFTLDTSSFGYADTADADQDDLPDWWEIKHDVTDPTADHDNDQLTNLQEYQTGRDPRLPELFPAQNNVSNPFSVDTGGRFADADGDGLPNWWEELYFGGHSTAVPQHDPDNDAHNNTQEYLAGTHPLDPASVLRIISILRTDDAQERQSDRQSGGVVLTWASANERKYHVEQALAVEGVFAILHSNILATPPQNAFTTTANSAISFYRITLAP